MLTESETKQIKQQLFKQIDSWQASEEKKQKAKSYIESLNAKQLEEFLIKNKSIKPQEQTPRLQYQITEKQCPFCLILQDKLQSYKIDENSKSLAILEINPLSKGHILVISKQHKNIDKIPSQAFSLAKKISRRIKKKLKAKETSIQTAELFGHSAINIIPIYENEKLEKYQASQEELKQLQEKLTTKPRTKTTRIKKQIKLEKAPVRFP